jgi:sugar transferase (PEP-CTERM/EpsH1 system associated)
LCLVVFAPLIRTIAIMGNILFLVHRLPYPPNKGDKLRSFHLLRHLQATHRVFLGTFLDSKEDEQHLPALREMCPDLHVERLRPKVSKLLSLRGLFRREPLTMTFYRSSGMHRWVQQVQAKHSLQASVVFTSAMAQYAKPLQPETPMLTDFVDVDSAKWLAYAPVHRWPLSWLYRREARKLLQAECEIADQSVRSFFVTSQEASLFRSLSPRSTSQPEVLCNGVDSDYFSPDPDRASPFQPDEKAIVFVGTMDYWPNMDAVKWFAGAVMPLVLERWPHARFHVVGRNPSGEVAALACKSVVIYGAVADVRPYLQHASAVVAPLRVARGLQNKILEAMAMAQPVIAEAACARAIGAGAEQGLLAASGAQAFFDALRSLLESPAAATTKGLMARAFVRDQFRWDERLKVLDAGFPFAAGAST